MQFAWEHNDDEWDPFSIVGTIEVRGTRGGVLRGSCMTLDSWMVALAKALLEVRAGAPTASVYSIHEPVALQLRFNGTDWLLAWCDQDVAIGLVEDACKTLSIEIEKLANDLQMRPQPRDEVAISELIAHANLPANK